MGQRCTRISEALQYRCISNLRVVKRYFSLNELRQFFSNKHQRLYYFVKEIFLAKRYHSFVRSSYNRFFRKISLVLLIPAPFQFYQPRIAQTYFYMDLLSFRVIVTLKNSKYTIQICFDFLTMDKNFVRKFHSSLYYYNYLIQLLIVLEKTGS